MKLAISLGVCAAILATVPGEEPGGRRTSGLQRSAISHRLYARRNRTMRATQIR
jgi:hypothetical protein